MWAIGEEIEEIYITGVLECLFKVFYKVFLRGPFYGKFLLTIFDFSNLFSM